MMVRAYILTDPESGEIRYVGITTTTLRQRLREHLRDQATNHRTNWIKALKNRGLVPTIQELHVVPVAFWQEAERYWIAFFRAEGCPLVNATDGGEGGLGHVVSAEQRAEISKRHKGKEISPEHRAAISAAATKRWQAWREAGLSVSPETRAKISAANKGRVPSQEVLEKLHTTTRGRPKSPEHREKIRQALLGRAKSADHRSKTLKQYMGGP